MKLNKVAEGLRYNVSRLKGTMPDAAEWLDNNDKMWELRRRGKKHDHKLAHDKCGRKLRDHYLPHIPIDAQVYARTWKALNSIKKRLGRTTTSEVWERDILPMIENVVRKTKEAK